MNKLFAIAVLATVPTLAVAAPDSHQFSRGGQTYVYTTTIKHSRQVIDGYSATTGSRFHLVVRNDMVSGESNGTPVSFPVAHARSAPIETAER